MRVYVRVKDIPLGTIYRTPADGYQDFNRQMAKAIGAIVSMNQQTNEWLYSEEYGYFSYNWVEFVSY